MPRLSINDITRVVGAPRPDIGSWPDRLEAAGYAFDTRLLKPGDLFFALKGEGRDGHEFVEDARIKGAVGAIVEKTNDRIPEGFPQIVVASSLEALQRLASHVRQGLKIPVVAISGSNGKTTTKEMLAHILGTRMKVFKSPGNYNNHIGVPMSLLALTEEARVIVLELGSNHRGEIRRLSEIVRPHVGVITNIGRAHIGYFGTIEAVAEEKTDILRCLAQDGRGVVNADDGRLLSALEGTDVDVIKYGITEPADVTATDVRQIGDEGCAFTLDGSVVALKTPGIHNVYNALAAVAAAGLFDIPPIEAAHMLETFEPVRMKIVSHMGITLMDDCYNANPDSVRAALDLIAGLTGRRKVFIMGEMLELGDEAARLHGEIGALVASRGIDVFIGIGGQTREAVAEALSAGMDADRTAFFEGKTGAKAEILRVVRPDDVVLVKGSRLTGLGEICDFLKKELVEGRT